MPIMPAICDLCGAVFNSGYSISGARVTMIGNRAGPCSRCGGYGHIPDGVYEFVDNVIKVVAAPQRSIQDLRRLSKILNHSQAKKHTPRRAAETVERELPAMSAVARELRRAPITATSAALTLVIAAVGLVLQFREASKPVLAITVEQVVNVASGASIPHAYTRHGKKVGRNEHCPCGSGKKYKHCCGSIALP